MLTVCCIDVRCYCMYVRGYLNVEWHLWDHIAHVSWLQKTRCSSFGVFVQIPPGPSTIAISNLGEECRGSCRFSLTLAVARNTTPATSAPATQMNRFVNPPRNIFPFNIQIRIPAFDKEPQASGPAVPRPAAQFASTDSPSSGDSSNFGILKFWPFSSSSSASASVNATAMTSTGLPDVPTSALFDPLAPRTVYAEVAVSGPQPGPVNVTVAVEGQATTADGVAVLAPKVCCNLHLAMLVLASLLVCRHVGFCCMLRES